MRKGYCDRCGNQYMKNYQQVINTDKLPDDLKKMCNEETLLSEIICCLITQHDWCPECLENIEEQLQELINYYKGISSNEPDKMGESATSVSIKRKKDES